MERTHNSNSFDIFNNCKEEEIISIFMKLSDSEVELLMKCFSENFDSFNIDNIEKEELEKIKKITKKIKFIIDDYAEDTSRRNSSTLYRKNGVVTGDIVSDRFMKIPYKRLTHHEEVEYMKKLKLTFYNSVDDEKKKEYLNYYKEMFPLWAKKYDSASDIEKEKLLVEAIDNARQYRNAFVEANMRLVAYIAKNFRSKDSFENLFQEGTIGLMKAIEKFDFSRGNKFSTCAIWWIRQAIIRYLQDRGTTIRVPIHRHSDIRKIIRLEEEYLKRTGQQITNAELMEKLKLSEKQLDAINRARKMLKITSLDEPFGEDDEVNTFADFVPDSSVSIFDQVNSDIMYQYLLNVISKVNLSSRERKILFMRLGIGEYDREYTYKEIAEEFQLSIVRIRQIESGAKNKIKRVLNVNEQFKDERKKKSNKYVDLDDPISFIDALYNEPYSEKRARLKSIDLSGLERETRYILEVHYALDGLFIPLNGISKILGISEQDIIKKEKNAFWYLFGYNSEKGIKVKEKRNNQL